MVHTSRQSPEKYPRLDLFTSEIVRVSLPSMSAVNRWSSLLSQRCALRRCRGLLPTPKHEWPKRVPDGGKIPVFAEDVRWIDLA